MERINLLFDISGLLEQENTPNDYIHVPTYKMDLNSRENTIKFISFISSVEQMFRNMNIKATSHVAIREQEKISMFDEDDNLVDNDPLNNLEMFWKSIKKDHSINEIYMVETVQKDVCYTEEHAFHTSRTYSPVTIVKSVWLYRRGSKNWREGENYFEKPIEQL